MMIPEYEVAVDNRHGDVLYSTVTMPSGQQVSTAPLLLLLHGFKGFRNYSFLPWVAQYAAQSGAIVVRMCFSLNGMNNTSWIVQSPDNFARNTISRECDDVADMITAFRHHKDFETLRKSWNGRIHLLGHSRGGGVAMIAGNELLNNAPEMLGNVALWNAIGTWTRWTPRQASAWKEAGTFEMQNQRTMQMLNMHASYVTDIEDNAVRLDPISACASLGNKLRFVHAQHDLTVPLREIQQLAQASGTQESLTIIENTTHTFGMEHPVSRITKGFVDAVEATFPWLIT